jgi:hypothetical protein
MTTRLLMLVAQTLLDRHRMNRAMTREQLQWTIDSALIECGARTSGAKSFARTLL